MTSASAVELRPLGVGEILDVAIKIYVRHFTTFLKIVLFVVLPTQVLLNLITASAGDTSSGGGLFTVNQDSNTVSGPSAAVVGALAATVVLTWLATTLATGACFKAVVDGYLGAVPTWRESIRHGLRRLGSLLWISLLTGVVLVLGFVLCILPGVYLWVCFALGVPVLFAEDRRGWKALSRSRELIRGRWWPAFGILVIGGILAALIGGAISGLAGAGGILTSDNPIGQFLVGTFAGTVSAVLTTPFSAAYTTVLYVDQRVRKEGFDLALLAQRMGTPPPAAPSWSGEAAPGPRFEPGPLQQDVPGSAWEPGSGEPPLRPPGGEPPPA